MKKISVVCFTPHADPCWRLPRKEQERLQHTIPDCRWHFPDSPEALERVLAEAEVYFGWAIPADIWPRAARLQWVHTPQVGIGRLSRLPGIERVRVTNASGLDREPVPQLALTLFLSLVFDIPSAVRLQQEREWRPSHFAERLMTTEGRNLSDSTVAILGAGGVGRGIARLLAPLVKDIRFLRRRPQSNGPCREYPIDDWTRVLPDTDAVFLAVPVTPDTRGFLNEEKIARFQRPPFVVNVGRGALIDESAVINALHSGRIQGYAADVASLEPLPPSHPLWTAPRTLLTPHIGAMRPDFWKRQVDLFVALLREYLGGSPPASVLGEPAH